MVKKVKKDKEDKNQEVDEQAERQKRFRVAQKAVEKNYGPVFKWLDEMDDSSIDVISTGCISLDHALSIGGFPQGRLVEVYGPPSSGKSSLALSTSAQCTKAGKMVLYVDAERALDPNLPRAFGVDSKLFGYTTPYTGEQCLDIMRTYIESGSIDMCVVDSITSMVPTVETTGDFSTSPIGAHAKLMSTMCRNMIPLIGKTNTLLLVINQTRSAITLHGSYDQTTGGSSIPFYSSHRVKVNYSPSKNKSLIKDNDGYVIGHRTGFQVVKNKFGAPFRTCETMLRYGKGYEIYLEILNLAVDMGLVEKGGGWFKYKDRSLHGTDEFIVALKDDKAFCVELSENVFDILGVDGSKYGLGLDV